MSSSSAARSSVGVPWEQLNARRLDLIDKKHSGGLSPAEEAELRDLQEEADAHVQLPPLEPLLELERRAIEEGFLPDLDDAGR